MDEVLRRLNRVVDGLSAERVEEVMVASAGVVKAAIEKRIGSQFKVKTGNLSRAIRAKKYKQRGTTFAAAFAAIDRKRIKKSRKTGKPLKGKTAPHAHLLEFGTSQMPAKPFFRPAIDESQGEVLNTINTGIKTLLGDATR